MGSIIVSNEKISTIKIDGRYLLEPCEVISYEYKERSDFKSDKEHMEWFKHLTVHIDDTMDIITKEFPVEFKHDYGFDEEYLPVCNFEKENCLPKYSYGEEYYWKNGKWSHKKKPSSFQEIVNHFKNIFPTSVVEADSMTIETKVSINES